MSLATVRAALVALFESVPDIGRVHGFQRYVRLESEMAEKYLYTPEDGGQTHLRGWQISNTAIEERSLGVGRVLNKHTWTVRGYIALNDEWQSEIVLDELVEAVRTAFRADPTLGGVCAAEAFGGEPDGVQKLDAGAVLFCGVVCNSALLQLQTWSYP